MSAALLALTLGELTARHPGIAQVLSAADPAGAKPGSPLGKWLAGLDAERLAEAQLAIRALFEEGVRRGDLRADLDPGLTTFFLVRMEFEILDLVPRVPLWMAGLGPDQALARAERSWFSLFWRGVAARPEEPLAFLAPFPEP